MISIHGCARWIISKANYTLESEARVGKDSKARGGYVNDYDDEEGAILAF